MDAAAELGKNPVSKHQIQPGYVDEQARLTRDGTAKPVSRDQIHQQQWVWKREAHINWSMVTCQGSSLVRNYLEVYWTCAGGLSAIVNAIGTHLRDPINSGLTR